MPMQLLQGFAVACLAIAPLGCTITCSSTEPELNDETNLVQIHTSLKSSSKNSNNQQNGKSHNPKVACLTSFGHLSGEWYEGDGYINDEHFYYKRQPSGGGTGGEGG